jgi:signal transduction histidine kinase
MKKPSFFSFNNEIDVLSSIAEKILANEDLESILNAILSNLREHLDAFGGGIVFPDETKKYLKLQAYTNRPEIDYMIRFIKSVLFNIKFPVNSEKLLLSKCYKQNIITESNDISEFFSPVISRTALKMIERIAGLKKCLAIPIRVSEKPIGILFTVFQRELKKREYSIIQFYANLSGLALDNHQKLARLKDLYQNEKQTTSMLSHELKTPVAIAYNSNQLLNIFLERNKKVIEQKTFQQLKSKADDMQISIQRINNICNSILSLREVEGHFPNSLQEIDLNKRFDQLIECFKQKANSKNLKFTCSIKSLGGNYVGGIVQLEQIVTILLDNAIKYTEKGQVKLKIKQTEKRIIAEVSDTGIGIPEELKEKVFERFFRHHQGLRKRIEGLGLGLYIAKRITHELNGKIELINKKAVKGSNFIVEIPVFNSKQ